MDAAETGGSENQWWTQAGASTMVPAEVAGVVAEQVVRAVRAKGCVVWMLNRPQGRLEPLGVYGLSTEIVQRCPLEIDGCAEVIAAQPVIVTDLHSGYRGVYAEWAREVGVASMASVPMVLKGVVTGVLRVYTATPYRFTDEDLQVLSALASVGAVSIENARVYQRTRALFDMARMVSSTLNLPNAANVMAEYVAQALNAKGCLIRMLDRQRRTLSLSGAYGLSSQYLTKGPIDADRSVAEALKGSPVTVLDMGSDPRIQYPEAAREEGLASMASVPMVLKGVVTGVLRVYTATPYRFTDEDLEFLSALASIGAAAIENAQLYDGIRSDFEALMDELVYMRRQARLSREVQAKGTQT